MENLGIAKVGALFGNAINQLAKLLSLTISCLILFACASSEVQRDTAINVDLGVQNAKNLVDNAANSNVTDSYQNASQTAKGALIGGAVGAGTGALATPIGVIPGVVTGAILGASYGRYIDTGTNTGDRLENRGVNVIVLGDQILIVIPSARIFEPMTPTIKPQAYSTLTMVARYINKYTKMLVKVSGYTTISGSPTIDLTLSRQQAEAVAKFLAAAGINARLLYAEGYGGSNLVMPAGIDWEESDNYRIEITLEKLYV